MMKNGMRISAANTGTVSNTSTTATMLPTYIEAISPQTKSFWSTNSIGPGFNPQIISPPIMTAAVAEPGMPSESIGNSALVPAAWSAVSGAMMPSASPLPKRAPLREKRLAMP